MKYKMSVTWVLAILCMFAIGTTVFAGGQTAEGSEAGGVSVSPPGVYPIVEETFTMPALGVVNARIQDMNTNYATVWWEEQTNVHVDWDIVTGSDAGSKVNLMLSSGTDLPDVFVGTNLSPAQQFLYGSQGVIMPIDELVEEHAPNIKRIWNVVDPYVKQQLTAPDGNVYGMSIRPLAYHSTLSQKLWINAKWLENLGLEMPATTDELYAVLKAFKEQDSNNNGYPDDEIPYSGVHTFWRGRIGAYVMNAFIYDDGFGDSINSNRLVVNNGTISPAYTTPQWRDGLRFLRKLADEGLLDSQAFVNTQEDLRALNNHGKGEIAIVGAFQGGTPWAGTVASGELKRQYTSLPPITGPNGARTTGFYPKNQRGSRFAITKDAQSPAVAIKWVDLAFTDEGRNVSYFGEEGVNWRNANQGEIAMTGEPALWKQLTVPNVPHNYTWSHFMPTYFPEGFFDRQVPASDDPFSIERWLWVETMEKYEGLQPDEIVPPLFMSLEDGKEQGKLRSEIKTYVDQSFARFVTGDLDIESDWDSYLAQFKALELDRYIDIVQRTYDRQYK